MSRWKSITIHHSGTKDTNTMSWDNIKDYHTRIQGWDDIGYHFGSELIEGTPQILVGRPLYKSGAHCLGHNHNSIGFMICGDFNDAMEILTDSELVIIAKFLAGLCVTLDIPTSEIQMHRTRDENRTCPGLHFPMDRLIAKIVNVIENLQ